MAVVKTREEREQLITKGREAVSILRTKYEFDFRHELMFKFKVVVIEDKFLRVVSEDGILACIISLEQGTELVETLQDTLTLLEIQKKGG